MKRLLITMVMMFTFLVSSFSITSATDAEYVLNSAYLTPTYSGFEPCDKMVNYTLFYIVKTAGFLCPAFLQPRLFAALRAEGRIPRKFFVD